MCVREDSGDTHAAGALHVHEVGVGRLDKTLLLVGSLLLGNGGVEQVVLDERHCFFLESDLGCFLKRR